MKTCRTCGSTSEEKPFKRGRNLCRDCYQARDRDWKRQRRWLQPEAEALLTRQGGQCAVCREAPAVVLDHCHGTEQPRGMLCQACNQALGLFKEDPRILYSAAAYVAKHKGGVVEQHQEDGEHDR